MVRSAERPGPLRMAFLGRLHPTKGRHPATRPRWLPGAPLQLDVFGIVGSEGESPYVRRCTRSLPTMRVSVSVRLLPANVSRLAARLRRGAVPSVGSNGPACGAGSVAAGVPVLGARLGGIAELVDDGTDGVLVEPDNMVPGARPRQLASIRRWWRACVPACARPGRCGRSGGHVERVPRAAMRPMTIDAFCTSSTTAHQPIHHWSTAHGLFVRLVGSACFWASPNMTTRPPLALGRHQRARARSQ